MSATLGQLREEHQRVFIGVQLAALLTRIATATARSYPSSYTSAGVWNQDSIADAAQAWTAERLIARRDLTNLLAGASTIDSLRAGLTRSFQQHLTNQRQSTSATNLYTRTVTMLRSDPDFQALPGSARPHHQLWTLTSDPHSEPSRLTLGDRLKVAAELTDDDLAVIRYGPLSLKSSPILRTPALRRFLLHVLGGVGPLNPADIMDIMRRRFALPEPQAIELTEDLQMPVTATHDAAMERMIAASVAARLGARRAQLLAALVEHEDFKAAGDAAASDEAAVRRAYMEMLAIVDDEALDADEAQRICGLTLETLFGDNE
ncbi:MAG TPA: hypothetical protein VK730_10075 [Solirubrobacteraceae bacterium]|jgi:hypothetical protein|nr:hypothetical protein [Solirubrobacteraceae bacterium]